MSDNESLCCPSVTPLFVMSLCTFFYLLPHNCGCKIHSKGHLIYFKVFRGASLFVPTLISMPFVTAATMWLLFLQNEHFLSHRISNGKNLWIFFRDLNQRKLWHLRLYPFCPLENTMHKWWSSRLLHMSEQCFLGRPPKAAVLGGTAVWWLAASPHGKKVLGIIPR